MVESEVNRLQKQIELEYEASNRVFKDFASTARHEYINVRQENISHYFAMLKRIVSSDEAMKIMIQAENNVYRVPSGERNAPI